MNVQDGLASPTPAAQVAPAASVSVNPLVWAIQLWAIASVSSLLLAAGLSRALRGAFVGAESWIMRVDHSAALTSQVAALCTALLLIYMGMLAARASRSPLLGMSAALLGAAPTILLFYAHRLTLPEFHGWVAALCGAGAVFICATQARTRPTIKTIVALGAGSLLSAAIHAGGVDGQGSRFLAELGGTLRIFFAWCTLLLTLGWHLWSRRAEPWRGALLLGGSLLLALCSGASSEPGASPALLLAGRALSELAPTSSLGSGAPLLFSLALALVFSTLLSRPGSLAQLVCALLVLACASPTTPLVVGWITLCGLCSVVICWVPDSELRA